MIRGVTADEYVGVRGKVLPFLEGFAKRDVSGITVGEFEADIMNRRRQLWSINDFQAVALTQVMRDSVRITHLAGVQRHKWQEEAMQHVVEWAKALGKKRVCALVRPGWAPSMKERGYREVHRDMMLEI